jgi:hypothetical protein
VLQLAVIAFLPVVLLLVTMVSREELLEQLLKGLFEAVRGDHRGARPRSVELVVQLA